MPSTVNGDAVTSVDNVRRTLVLLAALLYPLSDERAALANSDAEGYVDSIAARMRGVCGQSHAVMENSLKALTQHGTARASKKSRRGRRAAKSAPELPDDLRAQVDAVFAEYELPDAHLWIREGSHPGTVTGTPLAELVPVAARIAAAAVRLAALAAGRIDPSSQSPDGTEPLDAEARTRAEAVASGTVRTARRVARVLDDWDMLGESPTAIIGCPEPPGSVAASASRSGSPADGRRSLGVSSALADDDGTTAGPAAPLSVLRRERTKPLWSSGGAVQRD